MTRRDTPPGGGTSKAGWILLGGALLLAAGSIGFNIYDIIYVPLISVGAAMTTRMGHAIGAGSMPAVSRSLYSGMLISFGVLMLVV